MRIRLTAGRKEHPGAEPTKRVKSENENFWKIKSDALQSILADFSSLWAIHSRWSVTISKDVKVSQEMQDLKMALSQPSTKTAFGFWAFVSDGSGEDFFNASMVRIVRTEGETWAESVMEQTSHLGAIVYLFLVGSPDSDYAEKEVIIFRHPDKVSLHGVVKTVIQLQG